MSDNPSLRIASVLSAGFLFLTLSNVVGLMAAEPTVGGGKVDFNRDIRPILSDVCFHCHGPDENQREAELRLDIKTGAFAARDGSKTIVPGKPGSSELIRRITAADPDDRMPPADAERKLSPAQIELFRRWIAQGAEWKQHWSFVAPQRSPLPTVKNKSWIANPIDAYILARLERENLSPSPPTDKTTLIRRVSLDLTGLPPTPAEVDAFLADDSPTAYEKVVDRLLKSPRYGERMAVRWLDLARYADTSGYQNDGERFMWRWRDWVIEAFNNNMPYDQFTVEQMAGDLLPNPTLEQRIATAFHRNHRGNAEGGVIPEEFAAEYVVDRVETTATVWLGLTLGCTRCHDHKYDPFSQKEFYQLFAYFNNLPENGRAIKDGNSPPYIQAPTRAQRKQLAKLKTKLAAAEQSFRKLGPEVDRAQAAWEKSLNTDRPINWTVTENLVARFDLDAVSQDIQASGGRKPADAFHFKDGNPTFAPGKLGRAANLDGKRYIDAGDVGKFDFFGKFSCGAWINPSGRKGGMILSRMMDADLKRAKGYRMRLRDGKLEVSLSVRWLDDAIRVETVEPIAADRWQHVMMTYDGSRLAKGVKVYVDGRLRKLKVNLDGLNQTFQTDDPFRIGAGGGPAARFHGLIDDVRLYDTSLSSAQVEQIANVDSINSIVAASPNRRTGPQQRKLRAYFLAERAPQPIRAAHQSLVTLRKQTATFIEELPTVMVMQEMETPRETFVLKRGEYDKPGEQVQRGTPISLHSLPDGAPNNRLGLARWLVDESNPLTARVTVNRYWEMLFGTGIVKTVEDFGSQGEAPSHPQLLDWLAMEFVNPRSKSARPWDVKATLKTMVMSAAYRQSSKVTPALLEKDPENRLLARGPRFRLTAETIRDQALFVSGLIVEKRGGPSVKPYQPAGLWKEIATSTGYPQDHGEKLYRRSMYTFWKRTVAPPSMVAFDAAARETCQARRARTNTPLQALTLLNETAFVEAARVLAERAMTEAGTTNDRVTRAFRLAMSRRPNPIELRILSAGYDAHLAHYQKHPNAAVQVISIGEHKRNKKLNEAELAAWTAITGLILNLDEMVTKE
jgi:mono/diheme cytochrome c family protein